MRIMILLSVTNKGNYRMADFEPLCNVKLTLCNRLSGTRRVFSEEVPDCRYNNSVCNTQNALGILPVSFQNNLTNSCISRLEVRRVISMTAGI